MYPLLAGRRAMLSELRARPAPLLLLTSVLSETLAEKGDHISFVIGPFRPRLGPPSDPEPRGWRLLSGALDESVEPATAPRCELGSRVANAAGSRPRHLSETSRRSGRGWPRPRCAYRALLPPCPGLLGLCTTPPIRVRACARARPLFLCFAASASSSSSSSSSSLQYAGYWD
ncbi:LOW QUALITY PROTEIN: uncharacterized protein LOC116472358 [Hylobates moloch]|uniref:LOW QUALITY PROTEIN: uncharacterized protein LOC116472358 n=1 Tax=Hylobates moloch TaxID=81572 RepID=UPI001362BF80|nr:LOW QUALITY PROTEIN: uncharacterized protein LOC116472358 [Hylobates moloch]